MKGTEANTYDAIVVGTGISGGWAAMELCRAGLKTLVLERGRPVSHGDYPTANLDKWELPYQDKVPAEERAAHYEKLGRKDYVLRQSSKDWFVKDDEYPYTETRRFDWIRGYHTGGAQPHVGPAVLPPERPRLYGQRPRGHRHRLAHPLRRPAALVRPRLPLRRGLRPAGGASAATRRPLLARDAPQLCRGAGAQGRRVALFPAATLPPAAPPT